jgi:hypothetical protein
VAEVVRWTLRGLPSCYRRVSTRRLTTILTTTPIDVGRRQWNRTSNFAGFSNRRQTWRYGVGRSASPFQGEGAKKQSKCHSSTQIAEPTLNLQIVCLRIVVARGIAAVRNFPYPVKYQPRRPRRRRTLAAPRRDHAGASRGALPRRAAGVRAEHAGGLAPAAGGSHRHHLARARNCHLPGQLHLHWGDESMSMRIRGRFHARVYLLAGRDRALPEAHQRSSAGSH